MIRTPTGYQEIIETFGLPPPNLQERILWEKDNIVYIGLPQPVICSWNEKLFFYRILIHKLLKENVSEIFHKLFQKCWKDVHDIAGGYRYRLKRKNNQLSTHSWGIAIDINARENPYGERPKMSANIVKIFEEAGWIWGGRWKIPDGMHFQFAKRY